MDHTFLSETARRIHGTVDRELPFLASLDQKSRTDLRNGQGRSVCQIVGHMVDSASNNHQRIVRLQYNSVLSFPDYRQDNDLWIRLQDYDNGHREELLTLWRYYNYHIARVVTAADPSALNNTWTDFEGTAVTLREMVAGYPAHMELHIAEIRDLAGPENRGR